MKKRIIKNKKLFRLIIAILISFILGILYIAILSKTNKSMIKDNLELYFSSLNKLNYTKALINSLSTNLLYTIGIWLLGISKFNYAGIVDALISYKYPIDKMQAIINNYLLDPNDESIKQEFIEMQKWRSESKQIAKEILEKF